VERRLFIHAFSFAPNTTEEQVKTYMTKKMNGQDYDIDVEKIITKGHHASFKIGVPSSKYEDWLNPEMWPVNARINRWIFRRRPIPTATFENN
jgi:hypothetical protein